MPLGLIVVTTVLAHAAYSGARLTISLDALAMGVSPLTVGVLMSLIAALPMLLGVASGRLVDRIGVRVPMLGAGLLLAIAVALPALFPGLVALHLTAAGAGTGFMLFHIAAQHMVGEMSSEAQRKDNFGWLALGFATSNFFGPTLAGYTIDNFGHRAAFARLYARQMATRRGAHRHRRQDA